MNENSKNEINLFLDDLSKWCNGILTHIISELIRENSNELSELLMNEQTNLKTNRNVKTSLINEKTIDQFTIESEQDLKPLITKSVYSLALKIIYNKISENIVDVTDTIINEEFKKIIPELKNLIPEDKLKK